MGLIHEVDGMLGSVTMKRNMCVVVLIVCDLNIFMIPLLNWSSEKLCLFSECRVSERRTRSLR